MKNYCCAASHLDYISVMEYWVLWSPANNLSTPVHLAVILSFGCKFGVNEPQANMNGMYVHMHIHMYTCTHICMYVLCLYVLLSKYFGYVVINQIFLFHFSRIHTWTAYGITPDCDIITALHVSSIFSTLDQACLTSHSHWNWIKILLQSYAPYLNHQEKYFSWHPWFWGFRCDIVLIG
jgi:hypothetical protein